MNHVVTSKQELLDAAKQIVYKKGLDKLNIRTLAKHCNISIGTIYNYFPSKSDLLFCVIEDFWKSIFHKDICQMSEVLSFPDFFALVYDRLQENLKEFHLLFSDQLHVLHSADKERGRAMEAKYMQHMQDAFLQILQADPHIDASIWNAVFTPEQFVSFLFQNMIVSLTKGDIDSGYLKEVTLRLLQYKESA